MIIRRKNRACMWMSGCKKGEVSKKDRQPAKMLGLSVFEDFRM